MQKMFSETSSGVMMPAMRYKVGISRLEVFCKNPQRTLRRLGIDA